VGRHIRRMAWMLVVLMLPFTVGAAGPEQAATERGAVTAGRFALELDGVAAGWVSEVDGGHAVADVVTTILGADHLQKKHIGNVKYEEISVTMDAGMSIDLYKWLQDWLLGKAARKSGSIIYLDREDHEVSRLNFSYALITEVGFPALDAASKDAAKMTIKLQPEYTRRVRGSGQSVKVPASKQKKWLTSNFRLKIDGLDESTARVNKIEALTIKQKVVEHPVGEMRDYEQEATAVEIPNLVITLAESEAWPLYDWHEDFVLRGNNHQDKEKSGTLEFLAIDQKEVLFALEFRHLGIFKVTPDKMEAGAEGIRRVKAEMYCEDIRFTYSPAATFGAVEHKS